MSQSATRLVEFAQLWTSQRATNPHRQQEYQRIRRLASAADGDATFQQAAAHCSQTQEQWLIVAHHMTPEQAHAIMLDFAQHELTHWMHARLPGPPPPICDRFHS